MNYMAKKEKKLKADWNALSGLMKIYGNEYGKGKNAFVKYTTSVSTKDEDGEYINAYMSVFFSKSCEVDMLETGENWVQINKAFITVEYYQDKEKKLVVKPAIMVTDCEVVA